MFMLKCIFCGSFFDPFFFDDGAHLQGRSLSYAWYTMTRGLVDYSKFLFVCMLQGWDGYRGTPFSPLPDQSVRFAEDPQSPEFPLHHYSGLGTRTNLL